MNTELLTVLRGKKLQSWEQLLRASGLEPEEKPQQTVLLWDENVLAATGSRQGNLLKYLAVAPGYQGQGLLATILTTLRQEAFREGHRHLFLYTKPQNQHLFTPLLFHPVAATGSVLLMEDQKDGIRSFLDQFPQVTTESSAIVMNCDPFTLGHQHLIETAAAASKHLYVFVLSEDKGSFSWKDRLNMVKLGTADLSNVTVLPTGPYLISSATFPTYFLKEQDKAQTIQCQLDVNIFAKYYAPKFGITRRYVGTEPNCPITAQYNEALKAHLPELGIELREIPRLDQSGAPISATTVRSALAEKDLETLKNLVPDTTYEYLQEHNLL